MEDSPGSQLSLSPVRYGMQTREHNTALYVRDSDMTEQKLSLAQLLDHVFVFVLDNSHGGKVPTAEMKVSEAGFLTIPSKYSTALHRSPCLLYRYNIQCR